MRILIGLFMFWTVALQAQQLTNFNQIIAPLDSPAVDFQEYLVQIAWLNSPEGRIAAAEVLNAQDRDKSIRKEWMRDLQATFNLNEANLKTKSKNDSITGDNIFFPRYNIGVNINLYNILTQKDKNSISKRDILIAEQKVNQRKMAIRAETLSRYAQFKMASNVLVARKLVEQESKSAFVLVEQQYRTDEKTFEEYSTASTNYYQAQEARLRSENEVLQAQIRLEEILGLMWVQVVHPGKQ